MVEKIILTYHSTHEYLIDAARAGVCSAKQCPYGSCVRAAPITLARWPSFNLAATLIVIRQKNFIQATNAHPWVAKMHRVPVV
jgi:hypothetical protein